MVIRTRRSLLQAGTLFLAMPAAFAAARVRTLSLAATSADGAILSIDLAGVAAHKVFTLENPPRVVIDLADTRVSGDVRLPAATGPVRSVRSGMRPDGALRLVVELQKPMPAQASLAGTRLVVELGNPAPQVAASAAPPRPVAAAHAPAALDRDVVIAVDAGHGGQDPGAVGAGGTREKDVVLAIARQLAKRIDGERGMRAFLTRNEDKFIPLRERINLARRARADVFISVHADAIKNRDVTGSSVYVLSDRGASSEAARWLAEQENSADLKGGVSLGDVDNALASVLMDVTQSASIGASMEAAVRVLGQLDRVGTVRKTRVQQAGFVVLKSPDIPSMLVETAFISNPGEERKLRTPAHQAALADAIFGGVREHFVQSPPDGTLFARLRDERRGSVVASSGR